MSLIVEGFSSVYSGKRRLALVSKLFINKPPKITRNRVTNFFFNCNDLVDDRSLHSSITSGVARRDRFAFAFAFYCSLLDATWRPAPLSVAQ